MAKFIYFTPEEKARAQNTDLVSLLRAQGGAPFAPVESIVSSYIFGNFKNFRSNGRCFGDRREKMGRRKGRRRPSPENPQALAPQAFRRVAIG